MEKKWNVTAQAFDRKTGEPVGKIRTETVGTDNPLFGKCVFILDVKETYENFWNHLNDRTAQIVFVRCVKRVMD